MQIDHTGGDFGDEVRGKPTQTRAKDRVKKGGWLVASRSGSGYLSETQEFMIENLKCNVELT